MFCAVVAGSWSPYIAMRGLDLSLSPFLEAARHTAMAASDPHCAKSKNHFNNGETKCLSKKRLCDLKNHL